jgi:pantoate--beta-alanine ligase
MGALHEGHMRLIEAASQHHEHICVSIYVNPTQFGVSEDLDSYPVTWDNDLALIHALNVKLANLGKGQVSCIFRPSTREIYPGAPPSSEIDADGSFITITPLGRVLEGASRPVFFRGVATIVMKLLNIVQPHTVFFGQKDIQQAVLINRMIKDFHFPTKLGLVATQRLGNQLACSSRNVYLGNRRLSVGTVLIQSLRAALEPIRLNQFSRRAIISAALAKAEDIQNIQRKSPPNERARFEIDYVSLGDPATMDEIQAVDPDRGAVLSAAMTMLPLEDIQPGEDPANNARTVRLIDNILLFPVSALKTMDINQYT